MMAVARVLGKGGAVAGPQQRFALVLDEHDFAVDNEDELIFVAMPVPLRRPLAGRQAREVDAEILEAARIAEPPPLAAGGLFPELRRIADADD